MTFTTAPIAGEVPDADKWQAILVSDLRPLFARKTADESVTSSAVMQDDNELTVTVEANAVYWFQLLERIDATAASDYKSQLTLPSGATSVSAIDAITIAGTAYNQFDLITTSFQTTEGAGAGTVRIAIRNGIIITSSTAGAVTLQWAQNTSGGTATILKAGSYLIALKVA